MVVLDKKILLLMASTLILAIAVISFTDSFAQKSSDSDLISQSEHGCLSSSGEAWCNSLQKCIKTIEQDCAPDPSNKEELSLVEFSKSYLQSTEEYKSENGRNLEFKSIIQGDCSECWIIHLKYDADSKNATSIDSVTSKMTFQNKKVMDLISARETIIQITDSDCLNQTGRISPKGNSTACKDSEINIGEIAKQNGSQICCKMQNLDLAGETCLRGGGFIKNGVTLHGPADYCFFNDSSSYCLLKGFADGSCHKGESNYKCDAVGTKSEGYYDTYTKDLLAWDDCG